MELTPAQERTLKGLVRPEEVDRLEAPPGLDLLLRDELEAGLSPAAELLHAAGEQLHVNKHALSQVLSCERHHLAESDVAFSWNARNVRGTLAHKAIELSLTMASASPLELVDAAFERCLDLGDDRSPAVWLRGASAAEVAEVRSEVNGIVVAYVEAFPPLRRQWVPRAEARQRVELCGEAIVLHAKVDLALGKAIGRQARTLIIDLKTGRAHGSHVDDLRYYALVEAVRLAVPPFRVASFYLESSSWHHEDVSMDVLQAAVRRVVAGVTKLAELRLSARPATTTPCSACTYCPARHDCAGADTWEALVAARRAGEPVGA